MQAIDSDGRAPLPAALLPTAELVPLARDAMKLAPSSSVPSDLALPCRISFP